MEIKVLGTNCANCHNLEKAVRKAVFELGIQAEVIKEDDIVKILEYKILRTPGLVINGKVVSAGKVLSVEEIKQMIKENDII